MMATKACLSALMQHYVKSKALLFVSKSIILSSTEKDRGCQPQNPIMPVTLCYQGVKQHLWINGVWLGYDSSQRTAPIYTR